MGVSIQVTCVPRYICVYTDTIGIFALSSFFLNFILPSDGTAIRYLSAFSRQLGGNRSFGNSVYGRSSIYTVSQLESVGELWLGVGDKGKGVNRRRYGLFD
ncbi:hypothetical protein OE88DRAFT_394778 [Heliocybe sulcata]|uniref:Uncharacterized protein n=1 Tax=Heliocybe sulcata TaxID=5364 RepID=A0A5C3N7U7_9AGAM|nr:hypothetical protein OE88DRAFT_394778 [Heliocybe sulcata]